jgi:hypothetical protein
MSNSNLRNIFKNGELEFNSLLGDIAALNLKNYSWWASNVSSYNPSVCNLWECIQQNKAPASASIKRIIYLLYSQHKISTKIKQLFNKSILTEFLNGEDKPIVFYTFPRLSCFSNGSYIDPYWEEIMKRINPNEKIILLCNIFMDYAEVIEKFHRMNFKRGNICFVPLQLFNTYSDNLKCLKEVLFETPAIPDDLFINNKCISSILKQYYCKDLHEGKVSQHLLLYRLFKRFSLLVQPKEFYYLWENQPWESLLLFAMRESNPECNITGLTPASFPLMYFGLFPQESQAKVCPFPDKLITAGSHQKRIFSELSDLPESIFKTGCVIRQKHIQENISKNYNSISSDCTIGVATPGSLDMTVKLLDVVFESNLKNKILLRTYPWMDKSLLPEIPENVTLHSESELDFFNNSCIVIYSETSMGSTALHLGIPSIYIDIGFGILGDTAFEINDLKWIVSNPAELDKAVDQIINTSDESLKVMRESAFTYMQEYFKPINDENMYHYFSNT